jgi:hypothetical protein
VRRPLLALLVVLLALAAAACHRGGSEDHAFEWSASLPAGAVLHLRDGTGSITVRRVDGGNAHVVGSRHWVRGRAKDVQFVVAQSGNDYYVCAMWQNSGRCGASGYHGASGGGLFEMINLFHHRSDASAGLIAEVPPTVAIDARTTSGNVRVDGVAAGVTAHSVNGIVEATNVSGPVVLTTTNGSVRLRADSLAPSDSVRLMATNGSVHADVPAGLQGVFDLSVANGSVHSDLPVPRLSGARANRHLQGQLGSLPRTFRMRSVNGMVSLVTHGPAAAASAASSPVSTPR